MLIVSKKKLYATRFLMWGGLVVVALGAILSYASVSSSDISFALIAVGFCVSLLGAVMMRRLFRCPNCKKNVLPENSGIDIRTEKCPERCPHCGAKIQVEK